MILLDTHIWVWWVGQHPNLTQKMQQTIQTHQASGLGVSIFSCWEVAKLVELGKLQFTLLIKLLLLQLEFTTYHF